MIPAPELVEQALGQSRVDGCVVLVTDASEASLRWANSTMTTNGVSTSRTWAVISVVAPEERPGRADLVDQRPPRTVPTVIVCLTPVPASRSTPRRPRPPPHPSSALRSLVAPLLGRPIDAPARTATTSGRSMGQVTPR